MRARPGLARLPKVGYLILGSLINNALDHEPKGCRFGG